MWILFKEELTHQSSRLRDRLIYACDIGLSWFVAVDYINSFTLGSFTGVIRSRFP
jgi:hypothetical protein